ncbi:hypothetical protein [Herbaspirillum rhizosphaerae]|uniref:hypothetical protein n=1 Tax=Herbaspirillum rhizosphaerae TaxID=346179 RepID=UPI00067A799B|nr:hypothetical protein [Herbaspirillum rhizosphaerae]
MTLQAQTLADRYVSVWNQPDKVIRREQIQALWAVDGAHYVKTREARGYRELEERIAGSFEKNVDINGNVFRAVPNAQLLRDVVTFNWEMIRPATGDVLATGLEVLHVDQQGKILIDYQFIVS